MTDPTAHFYGDGCEPPRPPVWYGTCGHWTTDWDRLRRTGVPTCPLDGAPGFHADPEWWQQVDAYEADGHPGYRKEVEAKEIPRDRTPELEARLTELEARREKALEKALEKARRTRHG